MRGDGDMAGQRTRKPRAKKWLFLLLGAAFLFFIAQPVLKLLADDDVFTTPQVVYDALLLLLTLVGPPSIAVLGWDYLKNHPKLRRTWEIWPLAVSGAIAIPGLIVLAFMNLFLPAVLATPFMLIVLSVTLGAWVLALLSTMMLLLYIAGDWQS
jgi:hypothetical protein